MMSERGIRIPDITDISGIESHKSMVSDLTRSIKDARANFLVALGLFCYTEALGLQLLQFRAKDRKAEFAPRKCFDAFARDYLGYGEILDRHSNNKNSDIYDIYRNGLCHEYFIKVPPDGLGGVHLYYDDQEGEKFKSQGIDVTKGIATSTDKRFRFFIVEPYLHDFVSAVRRLSEEMKAEDWNPDLLT